ncbi:solute carrier family 26 member 6-like [Neocloeon triangulifer]|uniref:solute carrier family 26 member 6-like n=1 Tax=Neocloeon triangulifer TaxID=2078957 RepID=UPI00286F297E|nr:solute carrier family 26 member 6-like [Neocloeon triangulifer]XP_059476162.1 solute carrier family 26 member 6-like [Neocloeon triangulifer]XP_059476163.1 solute carrier family 26 member 6-like [Neocloeon triangulifer]
MNPSADEGVAHIRVTVERPVLSQEIFHDVSEYEKPNKDGLLKRARRGCRVDWASVARRTVPLAEWLPRYEWTHDLPCDLIAGFTVAVMQVPQGLGYALLANVPAIVGIYMAVFPVIPYILFGTSRHTSMGTFAVISLLVGRAVTQFANNPEFVHPGGVFANGTEVMVEYSVMEVATHITLLVGLWQILMFFLRLGSICALLSDVLVNSFTCGAGVHIFTSQLKAILGVTTQRYSGPFQLVKTYIEMVSKLVSSDEDAQITIVAAVVISAVCIAVSLFSVYIIKPRLAKVTRVPFPCELILVVAGVLLSNHFDLQGRFGLPSIGTIPKGLPEPVLPQVGLSAELMADSFIAAIVSYATLMSMALILARGEDYQVDANQELLAMGLGNLVGSCFSCIAFAASLSRSIVAKSVGGKTQLTALVSLLLIVLTLLWVADFFEPLPRAVLASIIVVALRSVLLQILDLPAFWRLSKADGLLWVTVFLSVVLIDIDYGLLVGFLLSAARVFMQGLKAYTCLLGKVPNTDLYLDIKRYKAAFEIPGFKIVHYCGPLNFATRQRLHQTIVDLSGIDPQEEQRRRIKNKNSEETSSNGKVNLGFEGGQLEGPSPLNKVEVVILDVSGVSSLDPSSANQLLSIRDEFKDIGVHFLVAGCSGPIFEQLRKCGLLAGENALLIYPSVHDAVRIYLQDI